MKNVITTGLLSSVFVLLLCAHGLAFASDNNIGVNSAVKGDVTIQTGEQKAKQAVVKAPVLLGDVINSNQVGSLQVLLLDQTMFTVGPDCVLTIDKFVYDPNKNNNTMSAKVAKGMFRFMSGNISKSGPQSVAIDTPVASMGIRGTMVEGLVGVRAIEFARRAGVVGKNMKLDMKGATLFVLRGPGANNVSKNRKGVISITSGGKTVIVRKSGLAVFVANKNSPPTRPFVLPAADFELFNTQLRTRPTGGVSYRPFDIDTYIGDLNLNDISGGKTMGRNKDTLDGSEEPDFIEPDTDFEKPSKIDFSILDPNDDLVPGCTPLNPHFPNCPL